MSLGGGRGSTPSIPGLELDGSYVPLGSTAIHEPTQTPDPRGQSGSPRTRKNTNKQNEYPGTNGVDDYADIVMVSVVVE